MISQILTSLKISLPPKPPTLPDSKRTTKVLGFDVPLYGELLMGEAEVLRDVAQRAQILSAGITKIERVLGVPNIPIDQLYSILQLGVVERVSSYRAVEIDYSINGYAELLDVATRAGIKEFTTSIVSLPVVASDGGNSEGKPEIPATYEEFNLSSLIERCLPIWINQGYTADHPLAIATKVLNKEPVLVPDESELHQFDSEKLLSDIGLTWEQAWVLPQLLRPEFIPELILACRIGDIGYSPLQFMTQSEKEEVILQLLREYNSSTPNVASNPNSEQIEESKAAEVKPLKSAKKTATQGSPSVKEGKESDKEN
jgi:hypothetical protein